MLLLSLPSLLLLLLLLSRNEEVWESLGRKSGLTWGLPLPSPASIPLILPPLEPLEAAPRLLLLLPLVTLPLASHALLSSCLCDCCC